MSEKISGRERNEMRCAYIALVLVLYPNPTATRYCKHAQYFVTVTYLRLSHTTDDAHVPPYYKSAHQCHPFLISSQHVPTTTIVSLTS